jgi:hypothetical protein
MNNTGVDLILILVGIFIIWYVSRKPIENPLFSVTFKGYALGICCIILGIIFLYKDLNK